MPKTHPVQEPAHLHALTAAALMDDGPLNDPIIRSAAAPCHDPAHTRTRVLHHHGPFGGDRRHYYPGTPCTDCDMGVQLFLRRGTTPRTAQALRAEAERILALADSLEDDPDA